MRGLAAELHRDAQGQGGERADRETPSGTRRKTAAAHADRDHRDRDHGDQLGRMVRAGRRSAPCARRRRPPTPAPRPAPPPRLRSEAADRAPAGPTAAPPQASSIPTELERGGRHCAAGSTQRDPPRVDHVAIPAGKQHPEPVAVLGIRQGRRSSVRPFHVNETGSFGDQRPSGQGADQPSGSGPTISTVASGSLSRTKKRMCATRSWPLPLRRDLLREPGHLERQVRGARVEDGRRRRPRRRPAAPRTERGRRGSRLGAVRAGDHDHVGAARPSAPFADRSVAAASPRGRAPPSWRPAAGPART